MWVSSEKHSFPEKKELDWRQMSRDASNEGGIQMWKVIIFRL